MRHPWAALSPLLLLVALLVPTLPVGHAAAPPPPDYQPWTVDDVITAEAAGEFAISPDGKWAAYVRTTADKERNEHVGQIWRVSLATGKALQLTRGPDTCSAPAWSPDGAHLAFLSARPAPKSKGTKAPARRGGRKDEEESDGPHKQVWLLDTTGGEPWPLTDGSRAVERFAWRDDEHILFTAQEAASRRETRLKDDKDTTTVVEDDAHEPPVRLFQVELAAKKVTRLTENTDRIEQFVVSPDGGRVAALHARSLRFLYDNRTKPVARLHDLDANTSERIFTDAKLNLQRLRWAPDGKALYATHLRSTLPQLAQAGVDELLVRDDAGEKPVPLAWPRGLAGESLTDAITPVSDGFLALLADGVRYRPAHYRLTPTGWARTWITGEHVGQIFGLTSTRDGKTVVYARSSSSSPTEWFTAGREAAELTAPRPIPGGEGHGNRRRARGEVLRWRSGLGDEVEGVLHYPHGYTPGRRAPLVVMIHGGPASADLDAWEDSWASAPQLYCQRGAFVLRLNYHGSTNYGLAWVESISRGRYVGPELEDIEKGVDALIGRGLVDPARLGLVGWSNGAILTNALITRTTRYRAAVSGAGSVEYVSDWASCEFGDAFDRFYLGKSPLEDLGIYLEKSPFHKLDRVRTPTLIFSGTEDRVVHPQQGWALYRGLQQLGKTEVRYVLFPGEKHSLAKLAHQRRKLTEEMAWMDRHLFAPTPPPAAHASDPVKEDSPLAWALRRQAAASHAGRLGVREGGVLAPETVRRGLLRVGRFEVTRAQYAEFDPDYGVSPGTQDYPVSGVTFERASAYCAWLARKTGRPYRLPTAEEADTLRADDDRSGENTLDAWAGYAVNPDDAPTLLERAKVLGPGALLRAVGRGRPSGKEEPLFDLEGNVAEWARGEDGKGVLKGGSADRPADSRGTPAEPGAEYRGLRVVCD